MKLSTPSSYDLKRVEAFIKKWRNSDASERANSQRFLTELTVVLGVETPRPAVADDAKNDYCFERVVAVRHPDGHETPNFIDLYKRGHFILDSRQGSERRASTPLERAAAAGKKSPTKRGTAVRGTGGYDLAMQNAHVQAERYARAPNEWPPFLVVCDVGYSFEPRGGRGRCFPEANWILGNPRRLKQPVENVDGKLNLWTWTAP